MAWNKSSNLILIRDVPISSIFITCYTINPQQYLPKYLHYKRAQTKYNLFAELYHAALFHSFVNPGNLDFFPVIEGTVWLLRSQEKATILSTITGRIFDCFLVSRWYEISPNHSETPGKNLESSMNRKQTIINSGLRGFLGVLWSQTNKKCRTLLSYRLATGRQIGLKIEEKRWALLLLVLIGSIILLVHRPQISI